MARSRVPWWLLPLLPAGLLGGWLVGQLPVPELRESHAPAAQGLTAIAERPEPRGAATAPAGARPDVQRSGSVPAVASPAPGLPPGELSQWTTLETALAESRRNGKPVLIDFSADWCGPCQAMKRRVFEDGARGRAVQTAVIPVSIVDRMRESGSNPPEIESLQERYQVRAFPTLVVFSPGSGRTMRTQGFGNAEATLQWITEAARAVR